jgi:hypothetical protein
MTGLPPKISRFHRKSLDAELHRTLERLTDPEALRYAKYNGTFDPVFAWYRQRIRDQSG